MLDASIVRRSKTHVPWPLSCSSVGKLLDEYHARLLYRKCDVRAFGLAKLNMIWHRN
jgi:hypothetical protein